MKTADFKRVLTDFTTWANAVPATPKNTAPRVTSVLSNPLTRDQAEQIIKAWGNAIVDYKFGPAPKPKRRKPKA